MRMSAFVRAVFAAACLAAPAFVPAWADGPAQETPNVAAPPVHARPVPAPTTPAPTGQTGQISLPADSGLALNIGSGYRYYGPEEARAFLQRNAAAEPAGALLGLIMPAASRPDAPDAWGVVASYQPIGYVPSDSADRLADPTFEATVRAARTTQGRAFEGFAAAPAFAQTGPTLVWAERSAAPAVGGHDLRHEQRLLGRRGVAGLTAVGSADQLDDITAAAPAIQAMLSFGPDARYVDFDAAADQRSEYDLPALVTGVAPTHAAPTPQAVADLPAQGGGAGLMGLFPWIAAGVAGLAGLGYLATRMLRARARPDDANINPEA